MSSRIHPLTYIILTVIFTSFFPRRSSAVSFSGTVSDKTTGAPVNGVLVAFRHTMYRTVTGNDGTFSLNVPDEVPIRMKQPSKTVASTIHLYRSGGYTVLDAGAAPIRECALYQLNGISVFRGTINNHNRQFRLPSLSNGLYLLTATTVNGERHSYPYIHTSATPLRNITLNISAAALTAQSPSQGDFTLTFRHDNYFPEDKSYHKSESHLSVSLESDPRALAFDPTVINSYYFTLAEADSLNMEKNALAEEYVPAEFKFNDTDYGTVGIRYKGSDYYAMPRCFDEEGNRSNLPDCQNVSLKVKFNKFVDDTRFYQMKRLNLHSMGYDNSKLREILAYKMFRDMGIYTCRTAFVKVFINGVFRGLFTAVENIDGRFTKSRWPENGDGNLYKECWPFRINQAHFLETLVTNDNPEDSASVLKMAAFTRMVKSATPETFKTDITSYMDMDYFLRYIAVDRALHNTDGIMTWYKDAESGWMGNHNYFFYEEESENGKFWLIPWDLNATFTKTDEIIDEYGMAEWNEVPESCEPMVVWGNSLAIPANCDKLTGLTAATQWDKFVETGEQMLETVFTADNFKQQVTDLTKLIQPVMQEYYPDTLETWEEAVEDINETIDTLVKGFDDYIHGRKAEIDTTGFTLPFDDTPALLTSRINNFEFSPETNTESWITVLASENSTAAGSIDTNNALFGTADLHCTFSVYPFDTTKPYSEWIAVNLLFDELVDLSECTSIRFCSAVDLPRYCLFQLQSPVYDTSASEDKYGWLIKTRPKKQQISVLFDDIDYPDWGADDNPDVLDDVLKSVSGITFLLNPRFEDDGSLMVVPDSGFVRIDNIIFDF